MFEFGFVLLDLFIIAEGLILVKTVIWENLWCLFAIGMNGCWFEVSIGLWVEFSGLDMCIN